MDKIHDSSWCNVRSNGLPLGVEDKMAAFTSWVWLYVPYFNGTRQQEDLDCTSILRRISPSHWSILLCLLNRLINSQPLLTRIVKLNSFQIWTIWLDINISNIYGVKRVRFGLVLAEGHKLVNQQRPLKLTECGHTSADVVAKISWRPTGILRTQGNPLLPLFWYTCCTFPLKIF